MPDAIFGSSHGVKSGGIDGIKKKKLPSQQATRTVNL
jgi:hypothetical protein